MSHFNRLCCVGKSLFVREKKSDITPSSAIQLLKMHPKTENDSGPTCQDDSKQRRIDLLPESSHELKLMKESGCQTQEKACTDEATEKERELYRALAEETRVLQIKTKDLERHNDEQENEKLELENRLRNLEWEKEGLHNHARSLTHEVNALQADLDTKEVERRGLKSKLISLKDELEQTQTRVTDCQENSNKHLTQFQRLRAEHKDLEWEAKALQEKIGSLTSANAKLENELVSLREYKRWAATHIDVLKTQNDASLQQIKKLETDNDKIKHKTNNSIAEDAEQYKEAEISKLRHQLSTLQMSSDARFQDLRDRHQAELQEAREQYKACLQQLENDHSKTLKHMESQMESFFQALGADQSLCLPKFRQAVDRVTERDRAINNFLRAAFDSYQRNANQSRYRFATNVEELSE